MKHSEVVTICSSVLPALSTVDDQDYVAISNLTLCFEVGVSFHLVNVSIVNDDIFETFQESFSAILTLDSPPLSAINISPSRAEVTIEDDDGSAV